MTRFHCYLVALLSLQVATTAVAQDTWLSRLSVRHSEGDGVGYSDGYTSVDWFLPLLAEQTDSMWFGDFRGIISKDSEFSSNVGTGHRWYNTEQNRIYGANIYWDTRQVDGLNFSQAGIGLETFGEVFDVELNGYTPAVNDSHQQNGGSFQGNNLRVNFETGLSGMDFMVGVNVPAIHNIHGRVLGGAYFFDSHRSPQASGWRVRLETAVHDWMTIIATAQDDNVFGRNATLAVELRRTVEHESNVISNSMRYKFRGESGGGHDDTIRHRLADPVRRQQQIVLTQTSQLATDLTNTPLTFVHVVPGAAGIGTFEDPLGTLTAAIAPDTVVYTPQGGTFVENVTLQDGTQLLSNGPVQVVQSLQGPLILPFSGRSAALTALPATIIGDVTLDNDTTLSGFDVTGTVMATSVTNAVVDTNRVRQPLAMDAVTVTNSTGILLNNLLIDQSGARGIGIDDSSAAVSMVTLSGIAGEGIDINQTGAVDHTNSIQQSSITSVGNALSATTSALSTGDITIAVANTTLGSTAGAGVVVNGTLGGGTTFVSQFTSNTVSAAMMGGVSFRDVTFDAMPGGAIDPLVMTSINVGTLNSRVTGAGVSLVSTVGDVDMGDVDIFNTLGAGLFVDTSPMLTLRSQAGSTVDTTLRAAFNLTDVTTALVFDSMSSVNSNARAASFSAVDGSLAVTTTTAIDASAAPFLYNDIATPFSVGFGNTTINSQQGPLIANNEERTGLFGGLPDAATIYNPVLIIFP